MSTGLAAVITVGTAVVLFAVVGETRLPTLVGSAGAVAVAIALGALAGSGREGVTAGLVGLLTVPVGASLAVAVFGTVLLVGQSVFPVTDEALIASQSLIVIGHVGLAVGGLLAAFGVTLSFLRRFDESVVTTATHITVLAGSVPAVTGIGLLTVAVLAGDSQASDLLGGTVDTGVKILLAPTSPGLHLATFLFVVAAWAACVRGALVTLPVAELLADRGAGTTSERRITAITRALLTITVAAGLLALPAFFLQLELSRMELVNLLGVSLYETIRAVTTAAGLRAMLVVTGVVALGAAVGSVATRQVARRSDTTSRLVGALLSGVVVTGGGAVLAQPVYDWLVTATANRLPGSTESGFRDIVTTLTDAFGEVALVTLLTAGLAGMTATVLAVLGVILWLGYLDERTAGTSLGAAGLFVGAAFAGTLGADFWLVAGGVLASLVVWDLGQFGSTLGREMGRHTETRPVELVHTGATVAVGLVSICGALVLGQVSRPTVSVSTEAVAALVLVASGLVVLVVALTTDS
jgi:hypothetical protein